MVALHCPVSPTCSCLCHPLLALCPACSGTTSALELGACWPAASTGSPGEGCAQAHTERQKQSRLCCSKAGRSRLFYPLLAGSAQQFLLSSLNAEAVQPLASARAVSPPRCRLSQQADGTIPSHPCPVGPGAFLENNPLLGLPEIAAQKTQCKNPQGRATSCCSPAADPLPQGGVPGPPQHPPSSPPCCTAMGIFPALLATSAPGSPLAALGGHPRASLHPVPPQSNRCSGSGNRNLSLLSAHGVSQHGPK